MTKVSSGQLNARFGGSALLVKREYLFVAPLAIMSSLLVNTETVGFETYLWLAANVVSLSASALWLLFFDKVVFARRQIKPVGFIWVVLFGLSLGALKGATTGLMAVLFGLETELPHAISSRVTQTGFMGLCLVLGITVIEGTRRRFQEQRDSLVAASVRQQLAEVGQSAESQGGDEIRAFVAVAKDKLSRTQSTQGDNTTLRAAYSSSLRDLVENNLRPLSHRLWQIENAKYSNFSLADMSRLAINRRQAYMWQIAAIIFAGSLLSLMPKVSFDAALTRSAVEAMFVAGVLFAAKLMQPKTIWFAWAYFVFVNALAAGAAVLGTGSLLGQLPGLPAIGTTVVVFLWLCQLTYFSRLAAAALDSHRLIAENLGKLSGKSAKNGQAPQPQDLLLNRELANFLHSNLQNRLLSSAMRIEKGDGGVGELLSELALVEQILESADADFGARNAGSLKARLADLVQRWAGFVAIQVTVPTNLQNLTGQACDQVVQVLSEAISNAVRHGLAANIRIDLAQSEGRLLMTVTDDGLGLRTGISGLGSKFFDSIAGPTGWSLSGLADGGTRLLVEFLPRG